MPDNNSNIEISEKLDLIISQLSLLNKLLFHNILMDIEDQNSIDELKMLEILDVDSKKKDHIVDLLMSKKNPLVLKNLKKSEIYTKLEEKGFTSKQISNIFGVTDSAVKSLISQTKNR